MKPRKPMGGFYAAKMSNLKPELDSMLREKGFKTASFPEVGVLLAAFPEFSGQGLWVSDGFAVAYDLDLTNIKGLKEYLCIDLHEKTDQGELIWRLFKKDGLDFLPKLRGAFGFAIWDSEAKSLSVATDHYGIRPVVFSVKGEEIFAASRISTLLLNQDISTEINHEAIYHYLFFSAICSPITIYKGVDKLEPGKAIRYQNGHTKTVTYYDIRYQPSPILDESKWIDDISTELERAVSKYVPLSPYERTGCFLSGGTDSSSVAGYYTRLSEKPAKTFSIGFDDPKYNELDFAHIASRHFGTEQHDYYVTPEDVLYLISNLREIYDEPFGNASVVPAFFCAQLAKNQGVNVLLGGDGGDEIFGGNERYVTNLLFEKYHKIPEIMRRAFLEPMLKIFPSLGPFQKAKRYVRRANIPNPDRFYSYNLLAETDADRIFQKDFLENLDSDCFINLARKHYTNCSNAHDTDRLLYLDMKFTITDNDLRKVTQMVESSGVTVRYPFLDQDLVDFTSTIPPELKVKPGKNRYIFKQAMTGFLPDEIITKTKHGMGMPIAKWFRENPGLSALLSDTLISGKPEITQYVRHSFLEDMYRLLQTDESTSYYGDSLWVYLILELWLRSH